jgi:hypothetical protein
MPRSGNAFYYSRALLRRHGNVTQVPVSEGDLVSLAVSSPGFAGTAPIMKCALLWRPR